MSSKGFKSKTGLSPNQSKQKGFTFTSTKESGQNKQPGSLDSKPKRNTAAKYPFMNNSTMTGLPWHFRKDQLKNLSYVPKEEIIEPASRIGMYTFTYDGDHDDPHQHGIQRHQSLVRHHPILDKSRPSFSTSPISSYPIDQHNLIQDLTLRHLAEENEGDIDDYGSRVIGAGSSSIPPHEFDVNVSSTAVRQMLLKNGFIPIQSPEMLEFYNNLSEKEYQEGQKRNKPRETDSEISLRERLEAVAAFGYPVPPPPPQQAQQSQHEQQHQQPSTSANNTNNNSDSKNNAKNSRNSKNVHGQTNLLRRTKPVAAKTIAKKQAPAPPPPPIIEPHPKVFESPKIVLPPSRQQKIIETQLQKEKNLASPKMKAVEYDARKRKLMTAALSAYDRNTLTDDVLVNLVDFPDERILFHNIQSEEDLEYVDGVNLEEYGINDDEDYTSTANTVAESSGLPVTHENIRALFPDAKVPETRPLDHFKVKHDKQKVENRSLSMSSVFSFPVLIYTQGSIMGSVMKEIEEENRTINRFSIPSMEPFLPLTVPNNTAAETQKAIRKREIAKQALVNYKLTKQHQLASLQRPKVMKLISKKKTPTTTSRSNKKKKKSN